MNCLTRIVPGSIALTALMALIFPHLTGSSRPDSSRPAPTTMGHVIRAAAMHDRRADHTATLLPDGRVLITGGMVENGVFLNSAELFDPIHATFVASASMQFRRVGHSATLLPNGKVLIAGGLAGRTFEGGPGIVAATEIYDPATGRFTAGPAMSTPRSGHAAVLLPNKKVLIAGGVDNNEHGLASAEIYDPVANRFSPTASMQTPRVARSAVVLQDGRVLVAGDGHDLTSAELYDPATSTWQAAGNMTSPRVKHAATLLPDGRVLITGGAPDGQWHAVRTAEIFDPRTNKFTAIGDMELPRFKIPGATAVLKNGMVLVAGGAAEVEVYDRASGRFTRAGSVDEPHFFAAATLLEDGRVLITGGYGLPKGRPNGPLSTEQAWIYQP